MSRPLRIESSAATSTVRVAARPTSRGKIIGRDPRLLEMLETIDRVAGAPCTVLVTGESGTGKELVVAALHEASPRRGGPLVTINCGAIPSELVESELFGHARGAFTDAQLARRGLVAAAEGGTLFLDEVGELPGSAQVKLLRLLQQREYTPVGDTRVVRCDVRIVAATHRELEGEVEAGRFREDLYYRLAVIPVHVPPLRERGDDVVLLAEHFFGLALERSGRTDLHGFSSAALEAIATNPWPGNVRALENAIERAVLLASGPWVLPDDVIRPHIPSRKTPVAEEVVWRPDARREQDVRESAAPLRVGAERGGSNPRFPRALPHEGLDLATASQAYQDNLIRQALVRTGGNKNRAAQLLGVNRTTLVEIIRRRRIGCEPGC